MRYAEYVKRNHQVCQFTNRLGVLKLITKIHIGAKDGGARDVRFAHGTEPATAYILAPRPKHFEVNCNGLRRKTGHMRVKASDEILRDLFLGANQKRNETDAGC